VGDRVDDRRVERLVALDRPAEVEIDGLRQVLPLGRIVEDVLAVDVGPGVAEVVLRRCDAVVGDRLDGRVAGGHVSPVDATGHD
jgi:hypothetical protein